MGDRYIDFDAARAEREREPLTIQVFGREFALPPEMPAGLYLDILRLEAERGDAANVTENEAIRLVSRVLPEQVIAEISAHPDFSVKDFVALCKRIMQAYQGEPGEARAPNRATRRAGRAKQARVRGNPDT